MQFPIRERQKNWSEVFVAEAAKRLKMVEWGFFCHFWRGGLFIYIYICIYILFWGFQCFFFLYLIILGFFLGILWRFAFLWFFWGNWNAFWVSKVYQDWLVWAFHPILSRVCLTSCRLIKTCVLGSYLFARFDVLQINFTLRMNFEPMYM